MNILLTGFTGNLGPEIARQLAPHHILALVREPARAPRSEGVRVVPGSLENVPAEIASEIEVIIHSAASTAFRAPLEELRSANVEGTARLLQFARSCPRLQRFVQLSTTCVCGDRTGDIPEAPLTERPAFINSYEQTKWEAEHVVLGSGLPVEIARLSIVAGSERDGSVRRPGAVHHTLYWLYKGLIPMMPARPEARVDLISTEFAASAIAALLRSPVEPGRVVHVVAGEHAPRAAELLDFLTGLFSATHRGWATGAIARPDLVDAETFALFEDSVRRSGDLLFQRVCADAQSFMPGLLHPRRLADDFVRPLPRSDWRDLIGRVFTWLRTNDWGREPKALAASL